MEIKLNEDLIKSLSVDKDFISLVDVGLSGMKNENNLEKIKKITEKYLSSIEENIMVALNDADLGICFIDIPKIEGFAFKDQKVASYLISLGVSSLIMKFVKDSVNNTPFTVHCASENFARKLEEMGIDNFDPNSKMGFHSDGIIDDGFVSMPKYLSLYNMSIKYRKPGCFHWLPVKNIYGLDELIDEDGKMEGYNFNFTPNVYQKGQEVIHKSHKNQIRNLFVSTSSKSKSLFVNGELSGMNSIGDRYVEKLKNTLLDSHGRISIEQKENRLILVNNWLGLHARDIFEEPDCNETSAYTRVFIRSMSEEKHDIKFI